MIINDYYLSPQPSRILDCGQPWHGLCIGSQITYPDPLLPKAWPAQPDSGDCWVIQVPGAPGATAAVVDPRHNWYNYALLSGWWNRQLYGTQLPGGRLSYVYTNGVGHTYIVNLSGLVITGAGSNLFGGTVKLSSTQVAVSPPAAINIPTQVAGAPPNTPNLTLDAARGIWDIVAINKTGSEVVLGFWPVQFYSNVYERNVSVTYTSAHKCRGMARVDVPLVPGVAGVQLMGTPQSLALLQLSEGEPVATLSLYKTAEDLYTFTHNESAGTQVYYEGYLCVTQSVGGAPCYAITTTHTLSAAVLPPNEVGCSAGAYSVPHSTAPATETYESEQVVGVYYKSDGSKALVTLRLSYDEVDTKGYTGASGGGSATSVGSEACPEMNDPMEEIPPLILSYSNSYTATARVQLKVDGVVKSEYARDYTGANTGTVNTTTGEGESVFEYTHSILLDGENVLPVGGTAFMSAGAAYGHMPYAYAGTLVGACRYSNHAYGLYIVDVDLNETLQDYLGGIVNVLDGTRTSSVGVREATSENQYYYPYTSYHVTVQPMTQTLSHGVSPACYV